MGIEELSCEKNVSKKDVCLQMCMDGSRLQMSDWSESRPGERARKIERQEMRITGLWMERRRGREEETG
jgi:hypothetical protein